MSNFGRKYNPNAKYFRKSKKRKTNKIISRKRKPEEISPKQVFFWLVIGIIYIIVK
jgi:hypothetical protein